MVNSQKHEKEKTLRTKNAVGDEIGPVSHDNYLGLIIDCNINFAELKLPSKLGCGISLLSRLSCDGSPDLILFLSYYECLYPYLSYLLPIWGNASSSSQ